MRRLPVIALPAAACGRLLGTPTNRNRSSSGRDRHRTRGGRRQYAPDEYTAATSALQKAHDAVDQRDFRQALGYALDARERAKDAARQAVDGKARARVAAEARLPTPPRGSSSSRRA